MNRFPREYDKVKVTTRRGFPLLAHFLVYPAEPDVGLSTSYFGDFYLTTLAGKSADWLRLTAAEMVSIEEDVWYQLEHA